MKPLDFIILAAIAVALFIICGAKTEKYEYLEKEPIELEYGVSGAAAVAATARAAAKNAENRFQITGLRQKNGKYVPSDSNIKQASAPKANASMISDICGASAFFARVRGFTPPRPSNKRCPAGEYPFPCEKRSAAWFQWPPGKGRLRPR